MDDSEAPKGSRGESWTVILTLPPLPSQLCSNHAGAVLVLTVTWSTVLPCQARSWCWVTLYGCPFWVSWPVADITGRASPVSAYPSQAHTSLLYPHHFPTMIPCHLQDRAQVFQLASTIGPQFTSPSQGSHFFFFFAFASLELPSYPGLALPLYSAATSEGWGFSSLFRSSLHPICAWF